MFKAVDDVVNLLASLFALLNFNTISGFAYIICRCVIHLQKGNINNILPTDDCFQVTATKCFESCFTDCCNSFHHGMACMGWDRELVDESCQPYLVA